jgi:hypothetical protein
MSSQSDGFEGANNFSNKVTEELCVLKIQSDIYLYGNSLKG